MNKSTLLQSIKKGNTKCIWGSILLIYFICFFFRGIEYMFLRTDQTFWGEAFVHKLLGIAVLFLSLKYFQISISEIGLHSKYMLKNIFYGILLGASTFVFAYAIEFLIQLLSGKVPILQLYVSSYSIDGSLGKQTGMVFFVLCVIGNIINVMMEEGIFRGLFLKLAEMKYSFLISVILSSMLFGIWHIAAPIRSFLDAERSFGGAFMMMIMLVITTGITGVKFCLLAKISGSLWLPMTDHFLNNTITNTLHISTVSGIDELQVMRITIAQTISFVIVLFIFIKGRCYKKQTFGTIG